MNAIRGALLYLFDVGVLLKDAQQLIKLGGHRIRRTVVNVMALHIEVAKSCGMIADRGHYSNQ